MKQIFKSTIVAVLLLALLSSAMPMSALAAVTPETTTPESDVELTSLVIGGNTYPYFDTLTALGTNTSWQTIASSTTGFNCNVYIKCYNTEINGIGVLGSSIRMLDKFGNVVWQETGAVPGLGDRIFKCGSNVYTIQIKTQAGQGTAYAYQTTKEPT